MPLEQFFGYACFTSCVALGIFFVLANFFTVAPKNVNPKEFFKYKKNDFTGLGWLFRNAALLSSYTGVACGLAKISLQ